MGQQQLLMLVLASVIVGIAIVISIQAFADGRKQNQTASEYQHLLRLANEVQTWKLRPPIMGGGLSDDPSDFSSFSVQSIGLQPSGGPAGTPFVHVPTVGCFRFFPRSNELRINALNEECVIGSWTKGIIISGPHADDLRIEHRPES